MKEHYQDFPLRQKSLDMVSLFNAVIDEYAGKGFKLTIRQLYYQMVSRGYVPNSQKSYDNIVALMTKARLAGLVDWGAIVDRTREVIKRNSWDSPQQILNAVAAQYHEDMWNEQPYKVVAIDEKEALAEIFETLLRDWDVPLLPARGYAPATVLRDVAKEHFLTTSQPIVVMHFGDHDPSGIDMSRDLEERLNLFCHHAADLDFRRLALNMDQIVAQNPPPFFAKVTDSRYQGYVDQYGEDCWELDALSPEYLEELINNEVQSLIDQAQWDDTKARIEMRKEKLRETARNWKDDE